MMRQQALSSLLLLFYQTIKSFHFQSILNSVSHFNVLNHALSFTALCIKYLLYINFKLNLKKY